MPLDMTEHASSGTEQLSGDELRAMAGQRFVDHNGITVPWFVNNPKPELDPKKPDYADPDRPDYLDKAMILEPKLFDPGAEYKPKGTTYELESNPGHALENPFDLRNLRFINPELIVGAVERLDRTAENGLPGVCVIATGGTIASKRVEGVTKPGLDLDFLFDFAGRQLEQTWNRASVSMPTLIDSSQMKMDYDADVVIAMSYIWRKMSARAKEHFQGFLITHGTDTMAPSATRIAMMLGSNLDFSVGIVGSQLSVDNKNNEIPDNLSRTLNVLSELDAVKKHSVFVYMGGSAGAAFHPAGVLKISDTAIAGFDSPAIPKIYDVADTRFAKLVLPFLDTSKRDHRVDRFQPTIVRGWINSLDLSAAMDIPEERLRRLFGGLSREQQLTFDKITNRLTEEEAEQLRAMMGFLRPEDRAIFAETYGSFTFDEGQVDILSEGVRKKGMLWFATNPFPTGQVHDYASAKYMVDKGAVPVHMLRHSAAVKLKIGEAVYGYTDASKEKLRAFLTANTLIGEQPLEWQPAIESEAERRFAIKTGQPRESIPVEQLIAYP